MYSFIRLIQSHNDRVWGLQALPWIKTPLIRVYRNRRKAVFEWVGNPKAECNFESYTSAVTRLWSTPRACHQSSTESRGSHEEHSGPEARRPSEHAAEPYRNGDR